MREEIETPGDGQIRAMVTIAGNPVLSTPDGRGLAGALAGLDFMVAVDIYLNETTRHADVILPPTSALERDQYDLVFHGFAVRNTARFTPAVFAKPDDARHDWEIFGELAERVTSPAWVPGSRTASPRRRGSRRRRRRSSPGCSRPAAGRRCGSCASTPRVSTSVRCAPTMPGRLQTPDERIDLTPELVVADLDRVRAALDSADAVGAGRAAADRPAAQQDSNSWLHNTERLTRGKPRHHLLMHPKDLTDRGLEDGTVVRVTLTGRAASTSR